MTPDQADIIIRLLVVICFEIALVAGLLVTHVFGILKDD